MSRPFRRYTWDRYAACFALTMIALSLALAFLWNGWDGPDTWPTKEERGQSGHNQVVYKR